MEHDIFMKLLRGASGQEALYANAIFSHRWPFLCSFLDYHLCSSAISPAPGTALLGHDFGNVDDTMQFEMCCAFTSSFDHKALIETLASKKISSQQMGKVACKVVKDLFFQQNLLGYFLTDSLYCCCCSSFMKVWWWWCLWHRHLS